MSFIRSVLILCVVTLVFSAGLLFLGFLSADTENISGYAVLTTDASVDDRELAELLGAKNDLFAFSPVTESSQWVMLDNFGSLETVPLDKYSARLSSFDPRNDGYAALLKNVFVHDGRRFAYIPLEAGNWKPEMLNMKFNELLGDIPFSIEYFGVEKNVSQFFIIYAAASLIVLIVIFVKKNTFPITAGFVAILPVLSSLAFFGAPGIACAACLLGFAVMLREPLNELAALNRLPSNGSGQKLKLVYKNVIEPYKLCWISLPAFAAAVALIVSLSELKLFFVLLVCAAGLIVFSLSVMTLSPLRRRRFTPVLIIRRRFADFSFAMYMLPLAAATLFAVILTPRMSGEYVSTTKFDHIIDEQDYYAHLNYQASFSVRQLGRPGIDYPSYVFGEDGLPSPDNKAGSVLPIYTDEFPPFPLRHLMDFFLSVNTSGKVEGEGGGEGILRYVPLLVLLLLIVPGFIINEKIKSLSKGDFAGLEKISGKLRNNKNWKKTLMYKNTLHRREGSFSAQVWRRFRKDA